MWWYFLIGLFIGFFIAFFVLKTSMNGAQGNLKFCNKCPYIIQNEVPKHLRKHQDIVTTAEETDKN